MELEDLYLYFRSRQNMIKTLEYRGYTVPEELNTTEDEFYTQHAELKLEEVKNAMTIHLTGSLCNGNADIMVLWYSERKLGQNMASATTLFEKNNIKQAIIVADEGTTPMNIITLKKLRESKVYIWVWSLKETMLFVPEHILVPEHRILSEPLKRKVMEVYGLKPMQFPKIQNTDVMVRYLGALKGQVIEIKRKDESDPEMRYITYRIVQ